MCNPALSDCFSKNKINVHPLYFFICSADEVQKVIVTYKWNTIVLNNRE